MTDITFKQVDHDLGVLHQRTVAMEGFQRWVVGHGVVTGDVARVIRVSLEDNDSDPNQGVTGKDLVTGLKKVGITIRNIVQWLLRQIGKVIEKIGLGLQKLGEMGRNNERALKALGNDATAALDAGQVEVPAEKFNPSMLSIAGEFVGHELEHAKIFTGMVQWYAKTFIENMAIVIDGLEELLEKHKGDSDISAFLDAAAKVISAAHWVPKLPMGGSAKPTEIDLVDKLYTVPMFGDTGFVFFDPAKAAAVFPKGVEAIRDYFVAEFTEYDSKKELTIESLPAPKYDALVKLNGEMLKGLEFWQNNIDGSTEKLRRVLKELETAADKISGGEDVSAAANTMANIGGVAIQRLGKAVEDGSKYLARTINQEMHYISTTIAVVQGGKK